MKIKNKLKIDDNKIYSELKLALDKSPYHIDKMLDSFLEKSDMVTFVLKVLKYSTCYGNSVEFPNSNIEHLTNLLTSFIKKRRIEKSNCDFSKEFTDVMGYTLNKIGMVLDIKDGYIEEKYEENVIFITRLTKEIKFYSARFQKCKSAFFEKEVNETFTKELFYEVFEIVKSHSNTIVDSFLFNTEINDDEKIVSHYLNGVVVNELETTVASHITESIEDILNSYYLRPNEISGLVKTLNQKLFTEVTNTLKIDILMNFDELYTRYTLSCILTNLINYVMLSIHQMFKKNTLVYDSSYLLNQYLYYISNLYSNSTITKEYSKSLVYLIDIENASDLLLRREGDVT